MSYQNFISFPKAYMYISVGFIILVCHFGRLNAQSQLVSDTVTKPISWNVSIGSSVSTGFNGGALFSTFIAPQMNYKLTNKWSFRGGIIVRNYTLGGASLLSNEKVGSALPQNITQSMFFMRGSYQPTNRLLINATVYKSFDSGGLFGTQSQINAFNQNFKGIMVDVNYKITEHSYITIGLDYSDGANNPFMSRTYGNSSFMGNGFNGVFR